MGEHEFFTLELYDELGVLVYTTYVNVTDSHVIIPDSVIGTYEIRLCTDDYYFQGVISL